MLLLLATLANAEFVLERVDVAIRDIKGDGSARVHESIKFIIYGDYSNSIYESGIPNNKLSFWSGNIGLKDVKMHTNAAKLDVRDFRLRPQPKTKCNPIQNTCHGELILDYVTYPLYKDNSSLELVPGTGLFSIEKYKPRTKRYTINPASLSFTTTQDGNIILEDNVYLTMELPAESVTLDVNPQPTDTPLQLPSYVSSLSWTDIVLVKFSVIFDVEESIDKEVADFFAGILTGTSSAMASPHGIALIALLCVLVGGYLYITTSKKRGEE